MCKILLGLEGTMEMKCRVQNYRSNDLRELELQRHNCNFIRIPIKDNTTVQSKKTKRVHNKDLMKY